MSKHIQYIIAIYFLAYSITIHSQINDQSFHSGLTFTAHTKNQDERTGLNLCPDKPMFFSKNGFSLEFETKLRAEQHIYGYICRVISDDSYSFDMISFSFLPEFRFVLTGIEKVIDTAEVRDSLNNIEDEWIKVRLHFNRENIKYILTIRSKSLITP